MPFMPLQENKIMEILTRIGKMGQDVPLDSTQNISAIEDLIEQFKLIGYDNVALEHKAVLGETLDFLITNYKNPQSRELFNRLIEKIETPLAEGNVSAIAGFDLHRHLHKMGELLETKGGAEFYDTLINDNESADHRLNVKKLWSTMKEVPESDEDLALDVDYAFYVFDTLCASNGKVNRKLQELSEQYPISFRIVQGAQKDGECRIIDDETGRHAIISLYEGAVKDVKLLPMLMAHELGHYVDAVQRPQNSANLPMNQEHTADILGAELAANAGYHPEIFAEELKGTGNEFLQKRAEGIERFCQLYMKSDLNRRLEELPNTPGGRKMKAFVLEADSFFDEWREETKGIDDLVEIMPEERKLDYWRISESKRRKDLAVPPEEVEAKIEKEALLRQQSYKKYRNKDLSLEECKKMVIDDGVRTYLYVHDAELRMNARFNPAYDEDLNRGYCTVSLMSCLQKSDARKELGVIFDADREKLAHPATLFKHLMEMDGGKYSSYVHSCDDDAGKTIFDVIKEHKMKPGALVCLTFGDEKPSLETEHSHLMVYTGKDKNGECCFTGFNNDNRDIRLKNFKIGYVCDTCAMTEQIIKDYHRSYNQIKENGGDGNTEHIAKKNHTVLNPSLKMTRTIREI